MLEDSRQEAKKEMIFILVWMSWMVAGYEENLSQFNFYFLFSNTYVLFCCYMCFTFRGGIWLNFGGNQ